MVDDLGGHVYHQTGIKQQWKIIIIITDWPVSNQSSGMSSW